MKRALLLAALVLVACKKKRPDWSELDNARAHRDAICACKDRACLDRVSADFAHAPPNMTPGNPDLIAAESRASQACIANLQKEAAVLVPENRGNHADALIAAARAWQRTAQPTLVPWRLSVSYVDEAGLLDAKYGDLTVAYKRAKQPVDDPTRKTGAPVEDTVDRTCPQLHWHGGWNTEPDSCPEGPPSDGPRCTVDQIWKRAIAKAAPPDALAHVELVNDQWTFHITDEPRDVHVQLTFPDDCEAAIERSP